MNQDKKRKFKIRYDRILICFGILIIVGFIIYTIIDKKLTNIYISGNSYLSDEVIIKESNLANYPKMISINTLSIKKKLLENSFINDVEISKKNTEIHIKIKEAHPIYFDSAINKTVLSNGNEIDDYYVVPSLVNYIPNNLIQSFQEKLSEVDEQVLVKISEIKYDPNIDSERFLLTMTDGNLVYVNISRFTLVNNYLTIISNFKDKKGIIYLDSGSHFEIFKK